MLVGVLWFGLLLVGDLLLLIFIEFMVVYFGIWFELDFDDCLVDVVEEGFDVVLCVGDFGDLCFSVC